MLAFVNISISVVHMTCTVLLMMEQPAVNQYFVSVIWILKTFYCYMVHTDVKLMKYACHM